MGTVRFELNVKSRGGKPLPGSVKNVLSQFGRVFPNMTAACNIARTVSTAAEVQEVVVEYVNPVAMATFREGERK